MPRARAAANVSAVTDPPNEKARPKAGWDRVRGSVAARAF
jgi:hypothetical protein